jgi:MFS family permease
LTLLRRGWSFLDARRLVMTVGFLGATTMTLMAIAPSLAWALAALDFSRFCFQFGYVALLAYGISVVAEPEAGRMNGFMNAVFGACGAVFNPVIGRIIDVSGKDYGPSLLLVGLIPLIALTCWTVLSALHARHGHKSM